MLRFRLRTFLLVITALCLLLGWRVAAVECVERPIRELEQLGWTVSRFQRILDVATLDITYPRVPKRTPDRTYWQKLLLGYRINDLPYFTYYRPDRDGTESTSTIDSEITSREWCDRSTKLLNCLRNVRSVDITSHQLTAESVAPLSDLKHVRSLDLADSPIGDEGLQQLAALTQLEDLQIRGTKATEEAVQRLQEALPECEIKSDYD